jgi:hypothetical protein
LSFYVGLWKEPPLHKAPPRNEDLRDDSAVLLWIFKSRKDLKGAQYLPHHCYFHYLNITVAYCQSEPWEFLALMRGPEPYVIRSKKEKRVTSRS